MKSGKTEGLMRKVAGVLYGVLAIYQMLLTYYGVQQGVSLFDLPIVWQYGFLVLFLAAGMAAWMFAASKPLRKGAGNAVVVITALLIVFELLTYEQQASVVSSAMYAQGLSFYQDSLAAYLALALQLFLMIVAAFFVAVDRPAVPEQPAEGLPEEPDAEVSEGVEDLPVDAEAPDAVDVQTDAGAPVDEAPAEKAAEGEADKA